LGNGSGSFTVSSVGVGSSPISVAIGDFNGDGSMDLAAANVASNNASVRLNNCAAAANSAPTITAAVGVTRQQGTTVSNSTIATVNDIESGAGGVTVTVTSANPSNGVTLSNIVNTGGTITADIVATCGASNASFTLQASDGISTATTSLSITVTANTAPTLTYANPPALAFNGIATINPATGPADNGSLSSIAVQSHGTYTGTISVNNTTGVVSVSNAAPAGSHTIVV